MGKTLTFIYLMAAPNPVTSERRAAEIAEWGTDKDVYTTGDRPAAFVEIKNTSDHVIRDAAVKLTALKKTPLGKIPLVKDKVFKASEFVPGFQIPPGTSRRFEVSPFQIPHSSLAKGTYELEADIIINDSSIGTVRKTIKVK